MKKFLVKWGIFIGLLIGCCVGLLFSELKQNPIFSSSVEMITNNLFYPMGNVFLQALFMIMIPLVFSSLMVGVAEMDSPKFVSRLSKRLFLFYACSTLIAIFIGQVLMKTIQPGKHISKSQVELAAKNMKNKMSSLSEKSSMVGQALWPGILTKIVPKNIIHSFSSNSNMLSVIFLSLFIGLSLLYLPNTPVKKTFIQVMQAISDISIILIGWIMKTAPFAVMALLAVSVSELGIDLIKSMSYYIMVMLLALLLHWFGTYSLFLKFLIRIPIREFFSRMIDVFTTAFSTSSSSATMPVTMKTLASKFNVPKNIISFSIPIGTVVNMDGTALFEVAATIFIAQIFDVPFTLAGMVLLVAIVFITSVGIAGVPGGSLPILMSSMAVLGIPPEGLAIILGVDRLMDMSRTVINVTGDAIATLYLAKKENVDIAAYIKQN